MVVESNWQTTKKRNVDRIGTVLTDCDWCLRKKFERVKLQSLNFIWKTNVPMYGCVERAFPSPADGVSTFGKETYFGTR